MQAREAVVLLEQARMLLAADNAMQLAVKHLDEAISEAERRADMLEDWYRRTYLPAGSGTYESGMLENLGNVSEKGVENE
jgi:hypothetical protein